MCGRYTLRDSLKVSARFGIDLKASYNIAPSNSVLTITDQPQSMKWSYNPSWAKKPMNLINARSETLREKPSFKMAKRCLIVADGWYEWLKQDQKKQPYYLHIRGELFLFGGIYNEYNGENGCAIVTREASAELSQVHARMPVMLHYDEGEGWLKGYDLFDSTLHKSIHFYAVNTMVNSPNNNHVDCIDPL